MTRIKICGIMTEEDARICAEAGVDALGFVVEYPIDVPWNLDRTAARELIRSVPPFVTRVIVVGDDPQQVVQLAAFLQPDVVQLHGDEPIRITASLVRSIHDLGARVIKPLRFATETGKCRGPCEDPFDAARLIEDTGVDGLTLDSVSDARPAGTGRTVDWDLARRIRESVRLPVILAGGLHAGNVGEAISAVNPFAVDVISGVEEPVGTKDRNRVRAFVEAVWGTSRGRQ
jgi:phosphoribosylanthranilate isomerase